MEAISEPSVDLSREDEIDLFAVPRLIWKNRFLVGAVTLVSIAASLSYARIATPQHEAMAPLEARSFSPVAKEKEIFGQVISYGSVDEFPSSETTPFDLVDATKGYNPLMEQIRNLRIRLVCPHSGPSGSLLVTSALPEEGKTSIASALSLSMARATPDSVILVDLDLHQPAVHRNLRITDT